jgi:hypothetical protein
LAYHDGLAATWYELSAPAGTTRLGKRAVQAPRGADRNIGGRRLSHSKLAGNRVLAAQFAASWFDTKLCSIGSQYFSLTCQNFSHFFRITMV